eukprot:TRINITY_DN1022_c0_g1_i1.p1 TRINITY_DN1022_c0_g1~~TRINITY_DN1022_c0_g1_i1.p1  ORF type:complete len:168 (-),score=45.99 TRINITY_DN1022_c0_g1_i1:164-667(-)
MGLGGSKGKSKEQPRPASAASPAVPRKRICVIQRHIKCEPFVEVFQKEIEESRNFEFVEEDCAVRDLGDLSEYEWVVYVSFSPSARWMDSMDTADREALKEFDARGRLLIVVLRAMTKDDDLLLNTGSDEFKNPIMFISYYDGSININKRNQRVFRDVWRKLKSPSH